MTLDKVSVEYVGRATVSADCRDAIIRLVQYGDRIQLARILTAGNRHCILLTLTEGHWVAVKSGFSSGYNGEGPRSFSYVLAILDEHDVEITEIDVTPALLDRLDHSALRASDLSKLTDAKVRTQGHWRDYIYEMHATMTQAGSLRKKFRPVIPFAVIDPRIADLARLFWDAPDERLLTGYRRLEDLVRQRTGINEHGAKLFSAAFNGTDAKLTWDGIPSAEAIGRGQLFTGAFMAFRNPRAHVEPNELPNDQLSELLLLNLLYTLESRATERIPQRGCRPVSQGAGEQGVLLTTPGSI